MVRIAIDLLWVRPGEVGGTEVYVRNLLDGFCELKDEFNFVLFVSKDNADTFRHYTKDNRLDILVADTISANIGGRIIWQYFHQNRFLKKNGIRHCFVPVYCRPFFNGGVHYINVIHDIQAYHFPQYHPFHENFYSYVTWLACGLFTKDLITTSEYTKEDIAGHFGFRKERISAIPIPVVIDPDEMADFDEISARYNIRKNEYYYTVSQNIPHKNLVTLIKTMAIIREKSPGIPFRLLVSGISGNADEAVKELIDKYSLMDEVVFTGYISNAERNCLCRNARAFLFPSYFEGFGIPPVEAMMLGQRVITTNATSIPEVTMDKAEYVDDYLNPEAWIESMMKTKDREAVSYRNEFRCYGREEVARKYLKYLSAVCVQDKTDERRV